MSYAFLPQENIIDINRNKHFKPTKKDDIFHIIDQVKFLKGTFVNQASLHGGSLENTLTVPLSNSFLKQNNKKGSNANKVNF